MNEFRSSEPRRVFVLSVQALQMLRVTDKALAEMLEEVDVTRLVSAALEGCDTLRLRPELQDDVEELRALMGHVTPSD